MPPAPAVCALQSLRAARWRLIRQSLNIYSHLVWSLLFLNNNDPAFFTLLFATHVLYFFQGHKLTHVFKARIQWVQIDWASVERYFFISKKRLIQMITVNKKNKKSLFILQCLVKLGHPPYVYKTRYVGGLKGRVKNCRNFRLQKNWGSDTDSAHCRVTSAVCTTI